MTDTCILTLLYSKHYKHLSFCIFGLALVCLPRPCRREPRLHYEPQLQEEIIVVMVTVVVVTALFYSRWLTINKVPKIMINEVLAISKALMKMINMI